MLKGRTVILFPDLNAFDKWSNKAKELSQLAIFTVSDLLERKATEAEREQGLDLADYLTRFNLEQFRGLPEPYENELKAFDNWISENPKGGLFKYENQRFIIAQNSILGNHKKGNKKLSFLTL